MTEAFLDDDSITREGKMMAQDWADERLNSILRPDEKMIIHAKGRLDTKPTSVVGSLWFWVKYVAMNFSRVITMNKTISARLVLTTTRIIILTNNTVHFPLYTFLLAEDATDFMLDRKQVAIVAPAVSRRFWLISTVGVTIETLGGTKLIFNGLSRDDFQAVRRAFAGTV